MALGAGAVSYRCPRLVGVTGEGDAVGVVVAADAVGAPLSELSRLLMHHDPTLVVTVPGWALDPGLVGGVPGRPRRWATASPAKNSRVAFDVIWGPLSVQANRIGSVGSCSKSSTLSEVMNSVRPSAASARSKRTRTWVEVSSTDTSVSIQRSGGGTR